MKINEENKQLVVIVIGDIISLVIITLIGFGSHGALKSAGLRMMSTFIPLAAAWVIASIGVGTYKPESINNLNQLWRPFLGMVLAGPLAAVFRGFWLNQPILPIFAVVLGGFSSIAIVIWRYCYWLIITKKNGKNG